MTDIETAAANLSEALTWTQICERYPDQWVVLVEVDLVEKDEESLSFEFHSARVAGHGPTRRGTLVQARPLRTRYPEMAHYFTGRVRLPLRGSSFHECATGADPNNSRASRPWMRGSGRAGSGAAR